MDTNDIDSLIIEDFEAFKEIVGIDGEQAVEEYLEYNAFYDIPINIIEEVLDKYHKSQIKNLECNSHTNAEHGS